MKETFLNQLRSILNHLYDPVYLNNSRLVEAFGLQGSYEKAVRFQRLIEEAVKNLKPAANQPPNSRSWLNYHYLSYRYLQQFSQKEVADQLDVSESQLYRIQQSALNALATYLSDKYNLSTSLEESPTDSLVEEPAPFPTDQAASLAQVMEDLQPVLQSLMERSETELHIDLSPDLPVVAVQPMLLRQFLLMLLTAAGEGCHNLWVRAAPDQERVRYEIRTTCAANDSDSRFDPSRQMADMTGAALEFQVLNDERILTVMLPVLKGTPVVVVDDSPDHIALLQRFTTGTRYQVHATSDPSQVVDLIVQCGAQVVILDVMMPQVDGWTLLQALRSHPVTYRLPVIVCSILPTGKLAESLSADLFLQKPIKREDLLSALDRLTDPPGKAER